MAAGTGLENAQITALDLRTGMSKVLVRGGSHAYYIPTGHLVYEFCNDRAVVSPDGRWVAYSSNLSGRGEIYVERYPELGSRQQISTGGGTHPVWSRDGRELFFRGVGGRQMFVVAVRSGTTFVAERPQVLFEFAIPALPGDRPYDITPEGRFIVISTTQAEGGPAPSLTLVLNWFEELKRLVPRER